MKITVTLTTAEYLALRALAAERNTARLRGWFESHKLREKYKAERNSHNSQSTDGDSRSQ